MHKFAENPGEPINTFILPFVFTDKVTESVKSIWRCHSPLEHRLILIDNSGEDFADRKWLEENSHIYIRSYRNLGPAVAFNLGIKIAKTEYVAIISDDARLMTCDWFSQAVEKLAKEEKRQSFTESYHPLIISANSVYPQKVSTEKFYQPDKIYLVDDYNSLNQEFGQARAGFGLACAMAKKYSWIKAGLFDETKYIYWIDGVFADQARKNGVHCIFQGVVFHFGDASHKGRLIEEGKFHQVGVKNGEVML